MTSTSSERKSDESIADYMDRLGYKIQHVIPEEMLVERTAALSMLGLFRALGIPQKSLEPVMEYISVLEALVLDMADALGDKGLEEDD